MDGKPGVVLALSLLCACEMALLVYLGLKFNTYLSRREVEGKALVEILKVLYRRGAGWTLAVFVLTLLTMLAIVHFAARPAQ